MKLAGQIALIRFPHTDLEEGKLRPVLLLGELPGVHDDWLICMISTQTKFRVPEFDELLSENDPDFNESGLRATSVIRVGRLAVVDGSVLIGAIGQIPPDRVSRIKERLAEWIRQAQS